MPNTAWTKRDASEKEELLAELAAVSRAYAVAEFQMDGTLFPPTKISSPPRDTRSSEIKGRHHSIFVDEAHRQSPEYREFWAKLNRGESLSGEARRLGKAAARLWLQATYTPILDLNGKPAKVFATAIDVTAQHAVAEELKELRVRAEMSDSHQHRLRIRPQRRHPHGQREVHRSLEISPARS